jgi:hypothetical protein
MSHSQVRPHRDHEVGTQQPEQHGEGPRVDRTVSSFIDPCLLFFSSKTKTRFQVLAAWASIALSGCGGLTYRSGNSLSGSGTTTAAALSGVSCGMQSLTGAQTKDCSVSLTGSAINPVVVSLSSNNPALTVPTSATVAVGASTAGFNAVSSGVEQQVSVTISASANGVTKNSVITLFPAPVVLNRISCSAQNLTGPTSIACSVSLSAAPSNPTVVALSSSSSDLTVPATVTVAAGATTTGFNATASAVTATEMVTVTAALDGVTQSELIQLLASTGSTPTYQVDLTWLAPASPGSAIAGYRVYRATAGSSTFQVLNSALDTQTTYVDSTVQNGQTYTFQVASVDTSGNESVPSDPIDISIPN